MAKRSAAVPTRARQARRQWCAGAMWGSGIVALPLVAALNPYAAVLMLIGLAPAIVAWITTEPAQRYCAHCIAYLNLAGVVPVGWNLFQAGASAAVATEYLSNPFVWLAMYTPAALGWVVYQTIPMLHEMIFMRHLERRRRALERRQKRLIEEWGPQADPLQDGDSDEVALAQASLN